MIKDKYIEIYNEFILQLHIYTKVIRILAKRPSTNFTHHTIKTARNSKFGQSNTD